MSQAPSLPTDPALTELREAYETGNLVIFAGAGVSASAGLPSWKRLVELLTDRARSRNADPAVLQEIAELAQSRRYIDALSALEDCLGRAEMHTALEKQLDDRLADEPEVARAIAALAPKLRAVLTTNIDHLLERAFAGRWPALPRATADIAQRKHFILKLHGTLLDRSSWIFTRQDYDRAMFADANLSQAFSAFFYARPLLFVGYGLADDDFDLHLSRVRAFAGPQPPRHFALVPADTVTPHRRKRLENSGVRLIAYENPDGKHSAVVEVLRQLAVPAPVRTPATAGDSRGLSLEQVQELLARAGVSTSSQPPRELARHFQRGTSLVSRLMRCLGGNVTSVWLDFRSGTSQAEAVLALPAQGGFVVALPADSSLPAERLAELSRALAPAGGTVRLYALDKPLGALPSGVEALSVREEVAALALKPLRAQAERCKAGWSDLDEHRFVSARARWVGTQEVALAAEALERALESRRRVLMVGDFGTGKSTHLRRRAALMARSFLEAPEREPAPVLLRLGGLSPRLEELLARHAPELEVELFRLTVDVGLAVPLLDGLDELKLEPHQVANALDGLLESFSGEQARVVVSSRRTLFREPERELQALSSRMAVLELEEFNRLEIADFVGRRTPSEAEKTSVLESVRTTHDLQSLARRPVLLELIVEHRERLSSDEMSAAELYRLATEGWLESRREGERHVVRGQRRAFARSLARTLFSTGAESATFNEVARQVLEALGEQVVPLDAAMLEVHTAVFLAHDEQAGRLRFAHKSFLEYFLAVDIAERLNAGRQDALDLPRITSEVAFFLTGMEGWQQNKARLRRLLVEGYQARVSENALLVLYFAARERVGEGEPLGRALDEDLPDKVQLRGAQLEGVELPWVSLRGADLRGAVLSGARLACADLRGARLDRARLDHAMLDGALLDGASFLEADLFAASRVDASDAGAKWRGADCDGVIDLRLPPARSQRHEALPPSTILHTSRGEALAVAWSPDRRRLASGHRSGIVCLWDARTGELLQALQGHESEVVSVAFSPDGATLASASEDQTVRLWNARSGEPLQVLRGHEGAVLSVAFSPDGATLASASWDKTVRLWNARSGEPLQVLRGHEGAVLSVAFSPDGATLATASLDKTVRLWNARSGEPLQVLRGHESEVGSVAFSPDGATLASASWDQTVRLWNARSGEPLQVLQGHESAVRSVAFSPDGATLASASMDGSLRLWRTRDGACLAIMMFSADAWVCLLNELPFFTGGGEFSRLFHYASGACHMPAALWAPLFQRPDLVHKSLTGQQLDLAALKLDDYAACVSALQVKRQERGLVRRSASKAYHVELPPIAPPVSINLRHSLLPLGLRSGGLRPPVILHLDASGLATGTTATAVLLQGSQSLPATALPLQRHKDRVDAATLSFQVEPAGPGDATLVTTLQGPDGHENRYEFPVSFVPDNPYIVGPPIENPRNFFGRRQEINLILRDLHKASIALTGEMRIGKTSLLHQLRHRLGESCQLVSLQSYAGALEEFPRYLAKQIAPAEPLEGSWAAVLDKAVAWRLAELARSRGSGAHFTLLLDEAQFLARPEAKDVQHVLRGLFQKWHADGLRAVVSGPVQDMRKLAYDPGGSPFLNMFQPVRLTPLSPEELTSLIRTPLGDEYTVTDEAVARIQELSEGRPHIAQLLCHDTLDSLHAGRRQRMEAEDIDRVFQEKVFAHLISTYEYHQRWDKLPETVHETLRRLAVRPGVERQTPDRQTLKLLSDHGLADMATRRLELELPFFLWVQEVQS